MLSVNKHGFTFSSEEAYGSPPVGECLKVWGPSMFIQK